MSDRDRPLYAVLIDGDNVPAKYAEGILKEVTNFAEPAVRKVYGDMSSPNLQKWIGAVRDFGLVAHQETANTKGKNVSDIGMVIDAMDILHGGRLDGFVIVSSDSDFTRLASRVREQGLQVIGMGEKKTNSSFRNACQRFIYLENVLDDGTAPSSAKSKTDNSDAEAVKKQNPTKAVTLIRHAMNKINSDDDWVSLALLGKYILADNADFDARTYGKAKLSDLIRDLEAFELKKMDGQLKVKRQD